MNLARRIIFNDQNRIEYIGETLPQYQSMTSSSVWRIKKFIYNEKGLLIAVLWANGNDGFVHAWDRRELYTY